MGGTTSSTFRAVLGGEQGRPSPRKGMQILFKRDERRLRKYGQVWALSAQPSPRPGSRHLLSTPTPAPDLLDWRGNHSWDLLRRYVTVRNAIGPFPLPVRTQYPSGHLGTSHPAVLGVFRNDGFQTTFSERLVMLAQFILPSSFGLKTEQNKTNTSVRIFRAFFCF